MGGDSLKVGYLLLEMVEVHVRKTRLLQQTPYLDFLFCFQAKAQNFCGTQKKKIQGKYGIDNCRAVGMEEMKAEDASL